MNEQESIADHAFANLSARRQKVKINLLASFTEAEVDEMLANDPNPERMLGKKLIEQYMAQRTTAPSLPLLAKIGRRFFPWHHVEAPDPPEGANLNDADCVVINVTCELSFTDRLKVLFSGRLNVTTKTTTEHRVGRSFTASGCWPIAPKCMEVRP